MAEKSVLAKDMINIVGSEKVLYSELDRYSYTYDSSFISQQNNYTPDVVVLPTSTEEVSRIMKYAHENEIPVTPRGAGSGQTGGSVPVQSGIVLDLSKWDEIIEIDSANMQVTVRPGIIHHNLNKALSSHGLFFPPDPGSSKFCTVGGMVGNNASGLRAVKFGSTSQYVIGLEVVLPDGEIIKTGGVNSRALKSVSGLDLTRLYVGSEGTLGVITSIRLKLIPKPPARGIAMAVFSNLEDSGETVLEIFRNGLLPSGLEIIDSEAIKAVNIFKPHLNLPEEEAILFFEINGNQPSVEFEGDQVKKIVEKRAKSVEWSTDEKRMTALWEGRSVVGAASARAKEGATRIFAGEDVTFPVSRVPEALRRIKEIGDKYDTIVVIYGHIGDGNMHSAPVIDPSNPKEVEAANNVADEIHELALEFEGSTTGEHGVGIARAKYMIQEHGKALDVMKHIKQAVDPKGIMNPGKIWSNEGEGV